MLESFCMEYSRENAKRKQEEDREELAKLYVSSKSWEEFKLAADVKLPSAKRSTVRAFWLYWAKKTHPVAYFGAWIFAFAVFALVGMLFDSIVLSGHGLMSHTVSSLFFMLPLPVWHVVQNEETMAIVALHEDEAKSKG